MAKDRSLERLGKISYLAKMKSSDGGDCLLKSFILYTINSNDEMGLANDAFKLVYDNPEFEEHILKLLDENLVDFKVIGNGYIIDAIRYTKWGINYFINNIDKIFDYGTLRFLIENIINDNISFDKVLNTLKSSDDIKKKDYVVFNLVVNDNFNNKNDISKIVDYFKESKSCLPCRFLSLSLKNNKYGDVVKAMFENYDIVFESESFEKLALYKIFKDNIGDLDKLKKYDELYRFYEVYQSCNNDQPYNTDQIITTLINNNDTRFLEDMIKNKEISFVGTGTTTTVYRVDDKVLKFTRFKHDNTVFDEDLFLLAPTITKYIPFNNEMMVLEIQDYLEKTYNNTEINVDDIINWTTEMGKLGYEVTDPLCKYLKTDNFGFLKNYKDANFKNNSDIEIPEWFKKRPLVLYDIDLIYKKEDKNKKIMKFH